MSSGSGRGPLALLLPVLFLGLAVWFYAWVPAQIPHRWSTPIPESHYGELAEAYRHGQLHLQRAPDPRLLALADPYDPAKNEPYRLNDLSLHDGRYYLYLGPAPAVLLLLPYRLLTGSNLTDYATTLILAVVGTAFALLLLADFARRAAPRAGAGAWTVAAAAVVFAGGQYLVLRTPSINHIAIASAYAALAAAAWAAFRAIDAPPERRARWLALASLAVGLAIASRPNYLPCVAGLLILAFLGRSDTGTRGRLVALAAALGPAGSVIAALLVHNTLRFGQPLEFGQRLMLGAWDQRQLSLSGWAQVPVNLWHYFVGPAVFSGEFPFISAPSWRAVGLLIQAPFTLLALTLPFFARRSAPLRGLALFLGVCALGNLALLLLLPSGNATAVLTSANARYMLDFLPALTLLGALATLALADRFADSPARRRLGVTVAGLLAATSALAMLSLDFQRLPAEGYAGLARWLNLPAHLASGGAGAAYGALDLTVTFPAGKVGAYEPLVATGKAEAGDLLFVHYDSPSTLRFGLVGTGMEGPVSPPVPVTYGQPHRLVVRMGSLYPPSGHAAISALGESAVARLHRTLQVELDGRIVYEVPAHFSPAKPAQVRIGATDFLLNYSAGLFSGRIEAHGRQPITALPEPPVRAGDYGALRLVLRFPANRIGQSEPLVVSGVPNAGDFAYVHYVDDRHVVIGFDHWGRAGHRSRPIPVDYEALHTLEIRYGALLPPAGHSLWGEHAVAKVDALRQRVQIVLDHDVVLDVDQPAYESAPADVLVGRNAIGGSTCGYEFTGTIKSAQRLPLPAVR